MACSLDPNHRISFSNDFVEGHQPMGRPISQAQSSLPPSSDFEFSVPSHTMISAEELFFKGQLLPLQKPNTLREELLLGGDDDNDVFSFGPQKGPNRWREIFGIKKPQAGPKKVDKVDGLVEKGPDLILGNKDQDSNILQVN